LLYICILKKNKTMEFIGVYKKNKMIGTIDLDEITIEFLDRMFQEGYEFMKLSKKDLVE
jgi:hypothetical protein